MYKVLYCVLTGQPCIDQESRCDKVADCTDASDERDCDYQCGPEFFMCETGVLRAPTGSGQSQYGNLVR